MALAEMRLIEKSTTYTRVRFEADSLGRRPLPLIEVDTGRSIETRSVREVVQEAHARLAALEHGEGADRRRHSDSGRGRGGRGRRDGGRRGGQWSVPPPAGAPPPLPPGRAPDADGPPARKISYYVDVDEPQVILSTMSCILSCPHGLVKAWTRSLSFRLLRPWKMKCLPLLLLPRAFCSYMVNSGSCGRMCV